MPCAPPSPPDAAPTHIPTRFPSAKPQHGLAMQCAARPDHAAETRIPKGFLPACSVHAVTRMDRACGWLGQGQADCAQGVTRAELGGPDRHAGHRAAKPKRRSASRSLQPRIPRGLTGSRSRRLRPINPLEIGHLVDPSSSRTRKETFPERNVRPFGTSWLTTQTSHGLGIRPPRNRLKLRSSSRVCGR